MSIRKVALDALKTKFEGVDEKVLSRIATKIAKTAKSEEDAKTEVEELTLQGVIDAYTDSRVTEGSEKAVKTYEEKHGLKDGKKVGADDDDDDDTDEDDDDTDTDEDGKGSKKTGKKGKAGKGDDDMPSWAKKLMEEVTSLKEGKKADTRKEKVEKLLENVPEKVKKSYLREFSRAQFKDDEDFESWIEEITPDIEDAQEDAGASGGSSGKPKGGGGGGNTVDPLVQARIDARAKAETATPAIKGLPGKTE